MSGKIRFRNHSLLSWRIAAGQRLGGGPKPGFARFAGVGPAVHWMLLLTAWSLSAGRLTAQTNFITLGNYTAHPTRILVKFKDGMGSALSAEAVRQAGSKIHRRYNLVPGLAVLEEAATVAQAAVSGTDESARRVKLLNRIDVLKKSGLFEYVEPDYIVHTLLTPTDSAFTNGTLWALNNRGQNGGTAGADIGVTNAWNFTTGSTNVIVAVVDTGIRYTHQELTNQMWRNPDEVPGNGVDDDGDGFVDDVFGINAITGTGDPFDDNNHGTHVSGTIGAAANDGHPHVGVTWHVRLMGCKFLSAQGFGALSDAITCIDYAVNKGAKIMNNSWGGGPFTQSLFDAINRARQKGVLFVVAAQNSGLNNDLFAAYPANYQLDNIIAVAAIDRNDQLADFSNFGQATVHLGAPGVDIFSSTAGSDSDYQLFDGTSMATPHVVGVAALILSQYPGADLDELRGRILGGVVPIPALRGKTITGGRLNAYNSIALSGTGILQLSVDPPSGAAILSSSTQPIFAKVKDLFSVTNATVRAAITGSTNLTFANNGQPPDVLAGDAIYSASLWVPASPGLLTVTVVAAATNKIGATNVVTYTIVPPPSNDNFVNATKVPAEGGFILSNNRFATIETNEPFHGGLTTVAASLWWAWSPTGNTNVLVDATGSAIDAVVAVYSGNDLTRLQPVAAAVGSVAQKKTAHLSFNAQAGVAYQIAVASADTNSLGSIRLRIAPGGRLDVNPPSIFIASPSSGVSVNNKVISISGTAFDSAPDISGVTEVLVKVNNGIASPAAGTTNWVAPVLLQPGANVIQAVAVDAAGHSSAAASVQVSYLPPTAPNDLFINATPLIGTSGTNSVNSGLATKEPGEPALIAGNLGGKSVWWTFAPPADGVLTLRTTNSTFDTIMALYTTNNAPSNASISNLVEVASNDDAYGGVAFSKISQAVSANRTYWIAVDGYNGASGLVNLTYDFAASNIFHLTINAIQNGVVSPGSGDYATDSTVVFTAVPAQNYEFADWEGDVTSTANPLSVVVNRNMSLTARFRARQFTDDFESGGLTALSWTTSGDKPWLVQSNEVSFGQFAARSGAIGDNQNSILVLKSLTAAGVAQFDYKVSSEANFDKLEFFLNGNRLQGWSGEVGWANYQFTVPAGTNTFEWQYSKDAFQSFGLDAAFIDNLNLPLVAPSLRLLNPTADGFQVEFQGPGMQSVRIEASADLITWQTLSTTNLANGALIQFTDPQAPNSLFRFYRAVSP